MSGASNQKFPLFLCDSNGNEIHYDSQDELINEIWELISQNREKSISFGKYLYENVLWHLGIDNDTELNTNILCDRRTIQLIKAYYFYEYNPHLAYDNVIWFNIFPILKRIFEPQRII